MTGVVLRRKIYDQLLEWKGRRHKSLLIKGQHQVGKTYIIREFGKKNYEHFIEVNFSEQSDTSNDFEGNLDVDTLISLLSVRFGSENIVPGSTLIFFDEIQECPRARTSLKYFTEDGRFDVIASGSLIDAATDESRTMIPVGYEETMIMRSLDFQEFLWAMGVPDRMISDIRGSIRGCRPLNAGFLKAMESKFRDFMIVGGMPESVAAFVDTKNYDISHGIADQIMQSMYNDVGKYNSGRNRIRIESCLRSIPTQLAQSNRKFMYTRIDSGLESRKAASYYSDSLSWIERAGIGIWCYALTSPEKPLESFLDLKRFKVYMSDTGLLMSMYGRNTIIDLLNGGDDVRTGAIVENKVAECITKAGYRASYLSRNKGSDRLEIDFMAVLGKDITAIEVKYGKDRSASSLAKVDRVYPEVTRKIKFENCNIHRDDECEHYPLFAAAFIDELDPYSRIELVSDD